MQTFVVRVLESSDGRLRGVAERVLDGYNVPFSDADQLIDVLSAAVERAPCSAECATPNGDDATHPE